MTGAVTMTLTAGTVDDAIEMATDRWRKVSGDPNAMLPWSTHIEMTQMNDAAEVYEVSVRLEFDKTQTETTKST